jgi:hypothetical protein
MPEKPGETPAGSSPAPAAGTLGLSGSVGKKGANLPEDVQKIQSALVRHGYLREGTFSGGVHCPTTQRALETFQAEQASGVDGRVDAGKTSERLLASSQLAKPRKSLNLAGPVGVKSTGPVGLPADVKAVQDRLVHHGYLRAGTFRAGENDGPTVEALLRFQRDQVGAKDPDGVVSPGMKTDAALAAPTLTRPVNPDPVSVVEGKVRAPVVLGKRVAAGDLTRPNPDEPTFGTRGRGGPSVKTHLVIPKTDRLIGAKPASQMTEQEAYAELDRLNIPYTRVKSAEGVANPVQISYPLLGVKMAYVGKDDRAGNPTKLHPRKTEVMDVRLAVGLAHTIQHLKEQAKTTGVELTQVNHRGGYVVRNDKGALRGGAHPRGLAIDLHSFVLQDGQGRESTVGLTKDWRTARSTKPLHANDRVVVQTEEERTKATANERWLRNLWGFLATEFDYSLGPSHNGVHWDHFHLSLESTKSQERAQKASFEEYGRRHKD